MAAREKISSMQVAEVKTQKPSTLKACICLEKHCLERLSHFSRPTPFMCLNQKSVRLFTETINRVYFCVFVFKKTGLKDAGGTTYNILKQKCTNTRLSRHTYTHKLSLNHHLLSPPNLNPSVFLH